MQPRTIHVWTLLLLLLMGLQGDALGQAPAPGWPESVAQLTVERTKAETCVALLKGYGDEAQISRGQLAYAQAKAEIDAVIAGLIIALAGGGKPQSLPSLQARLKQGTTGLANFCQEVSALLPANSGQRDLVTEIVTRAIEPLIKALSDSVSALYNNHRSDAALTRITIQTQLEAAKWPNFGDVKSVR